MRAQRPDFDRERELLLEGLTVADVVEKIGGDASAISRRHKSILPERREAFRRRIERDGLPKHRVPADATLNAWFVGLVDGEGCFRVQPDRVCLLKIKMRGDESSLITSVHRYLDIGTEHLGKAHSTTRPTTVWTCQRIPDLAEVLIPLFESIPLRSKKRLEYPIWKEMVLYRYYNTFGVPDAQLRGTPERNRMFAEAGQKMTRIKKGHDSEAIDVLTHRR